MIKVVRLTMPWKINGNKAIVRRQNALELLVEYGSSETVSMQKQDCLGAVFCVGAAYDATRRHDFEFM